MEEGGPQPTPIVLKSMKKLKIKDLKEFARKNGLDLVRLEAALVRYGKLPRGHRISSPESIIFLSSK